MNGREVLSASRRVAKKCALECVKRTAAVADMIGPRQRGLVILAYHRVGGRSGLEVDLPPDLFERHIASLAERGDVVPIDAALSRLTEAPPPARDQFVVTFDDGTADFAEVALPILERYRVPATVYISTDFVDQGREFPHAGRPVSWQALTDACATGLVTVGSHTHTHRVLRRVAPEEIDRELDVSIGLIEDRLGFRPQHFSYPKSVVTPAAAAAVSCRFLSSSVGGMRANPYGRPNLHHLNRSAIQVSDGMRWFERKVVGGMALEGQLREALDSRRYARKVT